MEASDQGLTIDPDVDDPDDVRRAKAIWFILSKTCKGKARTIVQTCGKGLGFLAWKRLMTEYAPKVRGRWNAMLQGLLHPKWKEQAGKKTFKAMITEWEHDIKSTNPWPQSKAAKHGLNFLVLCSAHSTRPRSIQTQVLLLTLMRWMSAESKVQEKVQTSLAPFVVNLDTSGLNVNSRIKAKALERKVIPKGKKKVR